jgi:heme/copper-type cytochrome/quinol oxidase subunit 4
VNRMPPDVTAAVIGYALGLGLTIIAFLMWRRRATKVASRSSRTPAA